MDPLQGLIALAKGETGPSGLLQGLDGIPDVRVPSGPRQAQPRLTQGPMQPRMTTAQPRMTQAQGPDWLNRLVGASQIRTSLGRKGKGGAPLHAGHDHGDVSGTGDIVSVRGIQVDRSIADRVENLLAAAERDGIRLGGSGYRSIAAQTDLYNRWRNGTYRVPAVARPGRSMHNHGLAIDFSNLGNSGFNWLQQNAGRFGFYNLPSERWHWSVNGR